MEAIDELQDTSSAPPDASYYTRRKPPRQDCDSEKMVTIEAISLRRGGWRNTEGFLNDLRHMDPKVGVVLFFGAMTAVIFFMFWRNYNSLGKSALYTTSSVALISVSLSAAFGIDFLGAIGAAIVPP